MKNTIRATVVIGLLLLGVVRVNAQFDEDFRIWNHVAVVPYEDEDVKFVGLTQGRWNDSGDYLGTYLFDLMGYWKADENVAFGIGYDYCRARTAANNPFVRVHMLNVDVKPTFTLNDRFVFAGRHRLEVRWQDTRGDDPYYVSRWYGSLVMKTPELAPLKSLAIATEPFFDYERAAFNENRFQPLVATFSVARGIDFQLYGMLRSIKPAGGADWQTAYIAGTGIHISLPNR